MAKLLERKRFIVAAGVVFGLTLAGLGASRLLAQQEEVGSASADEAAKMFIAILTVAELRPMSGHGGIVSLHKESRENLRLLSAKDFDQLGEDAIDEVLEEFAIKVLLSRWQTQTTPTAQENSAVVHVTSGSDLKPVVCVREGEYWYVDLVETAKHWFQPNDRAMQRIQYELSGVDPGGRRANQLCQSNLKQIALAMKMYVEDYDEMYAPANKWCDVIQPYTKNEKLFHCPAAGKDQYGYAMNWKLSRRSEAAIEYTPDTVLFYESNVLRRNQNGDGKDLTFRHTVENVLGANYAYTDGHVAWRRQNAAQNFRLAPPKPPRQGMPQYTTVINKPH